MAKKQELEIVIDPKGEVSILTKGVKGKKCLHYLKQFEKEIGRVKVKRFTSEYYEPEPEVGIRVPKKKSI